MARAIGVGPRVMQSRQQHVADKDLLSLGDVKHHIHLGGIRRVVVLLDLHVRLVKSAAQIFGDQRIAVAGQVARRKQLPGFGVQQRQQLRCSTCLLPSSLTLPTRCCWPSSM